MIAKLLMIFVVIAPDGRLLEGAVHSLDLTDPWQAAGYLGMSLEVLLNTYGHHHPDYLADAVEKIAKRERKVDGNRGSFGSVLELHSEKK